MTLIRFLLKESNISLFRLGGMAALAGMMNAALLAIINVAAANAVDQASNTRYLFLFTIAIAIYILAQKHLMTSSTLLVETTLNNVRQRLTNKIRQTDLLPLERIGRARIYASVNTEVQTISQASQPIIILCQFAFLVGFSLVYLAWLSVIALVLVLALLALLVYIHRQGLHELLGYMRESLVRDNHFFDALTHVLDGFKEVKMNEARSRDLYHHVQDTSASVTELKIKVGRQFAVQFIFSQTALYILIAGIVFLLPRLSATYNEVVTKATATILFIFGPLSSLVGGLPLFEQAKVAIDRIYDLERQLDTQVSAPATADFDRPSAPAIQTFGRIEMEQVLFQYTDPMGAPLFRVGPLDLTIKSGETIFIVGGNGSGKSTFLKLLTTLYYPLSGQIKLDRAPLSRASYTHYRNLFSIIFSDYHLFDRLYGLAEADPTRVEDLLRFFELQDKTSFVEGRFVNQELSGGQRKRLALLVTFLEDRPIQVFDEWAADQDPIFRRYFYESILTNMKQQGKTIIAATHDDRYFHVADRVLKMEHGEFVPG